MQRVLCRFPRASSSARSSITKLTMTVSNYGIALVSHTRLLYDDGHQRALVAVRARPHPSAMEGRSGRLSAVVESVARVTAAA